MTAAQDRFDLQIVYENFKLSLLDNDDIAIDAYLLGYKELNKFFQLMGTVFGFVSSDVKSKIDILDEFRNKEKDKSDKFASFKSMLDYEKTSGLLNKTDYVSGSRTLLRLHRGLDFIREFLRALGELQPDDKTCTVCQNAYNNTLAQYHPWLIRKGAVMAMYTLPTRDQLLNRVCLDVQKAIPLLPDMLAITKNVYELTEELYTQFNLHQLP